MPDTFELGDERVVLSTEVVSSMSARLPEVAQLAVAALTDEVPAYGSTLDEEMAAVITAAVEMALDTFLRIVGAGPGTGRPPLDAARSGAYDLGRGEARAGRSVDALLAAYRVGARASWRELSATAVEHGTAADDVGRFAELVFAYIDELSAASVAGHADELATSGRLHRQRREELARALLSEAAPEASVIELAERARWPLPERLTAVVLPSAHAHDALLRLSASVLSLPADAAGLDGLDDQTVLLVPDAVRTRAHLVEALDGRDAVVGPDRPWRRVAGSLAIALRARQVLGPEGHGVLDTTLHRGTLVVTADDGALRDLREEVLAPLRDLTPAAQERLTETLRAWLLHLGRRSEVAEALHVHPQTVRYRMNQLKDLYGERLDDPGFVQAVTVALAGPLRD